MIAAICIALVYQFVRPYRLQALYIENNGGKAEAIEADAIAPNWTHHIFGKLASIRGITATRIDEEDAATFAAMTDLKEITLRGSIDDSVAGCFREMTELREIDTSFSLVSLTALTGLPNPQGVRVLKLGMNTNDNELISSLNRFPNLVSLDLHATQVTDQGLVAVAKCKQLKALNLDGRPVTTSGLSHLQNLANLKSISLQWCDRLDARATELLRSFPSLIRVELLNNHMSFRQRTQLLDIGK